VGIDHDTAACAVETARRWWRHRGSKVYPRAKRLLITADGGGSNGSRCRLWAERLRSRYGAGYGGLLAVGDPDTVAGDLKQLADAGFDGFCFSFVAYNDEMPYFIQGFPTSPRAHGLAAGAEIAQTTSSSLSGRKGRLRKIEMRLGDAGPDRGRRVELERPLGREVVVQEAQGGGRALHQEVLGFGGVREAAVLLRQEAGGY
jgi:hypothetical protein